MSTTDEDKTTNSIKYLRLSQLHCALSSSYYAQYSSVIEGILDRGGDVNYAIPSGSSVEYHSPHWLGCTSLHFAITSGCDGLGLKVLLNRGADFTIKSHNGSTALRLAVEISENRRLRCFDLKGRLKHTMGDLILSAHVSATNATNPRCKNGISHLHIACMLNHKEAVELFLKNGVSVDEAVNMKSSVLPGYTPLHFAARYCSLEAASVLLNYNANIKLKDDAGMTPLHLLIERNREIVDSINMGKKISYARFEQELDINESMIDLLLEKHKANNPKCIIIDDISLSHFHVACTKKLSECAEKNLLKRSVDIDAPINLDSPIWPGYTPLHFAAHFNIKLVKLLLEHEANIAAKDAKGLTPLDLCMERYEPKDICTILSFQHLKNILMSDNTKLLDNIHNLHGPLFADTIEMREMIGLKGIHNHVTMDSPLWAGYTSLHLTVAFAKRIECSDVLHEKADYQREKNSENLSKYSSEIENSMALIVSCIKCGASITVQCANGMTPLHLAFRQQKKHIVTLLIENTHFKENVIDLENLSHLHILCAEGRKEEIETILHSHININSSIKTGFKWYDSEDTLRATFVRAGSTALHISVAFGYVEVIKLLLKHGADPLARDDDGLTPLHLAFVTHSTNGTKIDVINALLTAPGIDNVNLATREGLSHLQIACFANNRPVVEKLLRLEAADVNAPITCRLGDTHAANPEAIRANDYFISGRDVSGDFLPLAPYAGYGPLHLAVKGRALETLELLLSSGADALAKNAVGFTPLQLALSIHSYSYDQENRSIVDRLTAASRDAAHDPDVSLSEANNGLTSLHLACATLDKVAAERALASGADVDARLDLDSPIWPGYTPLHVLVGNVEHYTSLVELADIGTIAELLLLDHQADVNLRNADNSTPVHALSEYHTDQHSGRIIDMLLRSSHIFEANPVDNNGLSHFHVACMRNDPSIVDEYLTRGLADIQQSKDCFLDYQAGYTPLHFAMAHSCSPAVIQMLLRHGANPSVEDAYGYTPLHVANRIHIYGANAWGNAEAILRMYIACISLAHSFGNPDINATDIYGETALERSFKFGDKGMIGVLLKHGARVNVINPVSMVGLLAISVRRRLTEDDDRVVFQLVMEDATDLTGIDPDTGFNAVHNIVSSSRLHCSKRYINQIGQLLQIGCELEHRDNKGRTALHVAVEFKSKSAVIALLDLGADINIADANGLVPLDYSIDPYTESILFVHIVKLTCVGLHVDERNQSYYSTMKEGNASYKMMYSHELKEMEKVEVDGDYNLPDFLTEAALADYPGMSQQRRQAIGEYVGFSELLTKFPLLGCLLRLQYRKALVRLKLMEPSKDALVFLAGRGLPDPCTETVITFLSNDDLKNLNAFRT